VGAAVTGQRPLESFEFRPLIAFGTALLLLSILGFWKPQIVFWPIGAVLAALGLQLIVRGLQARLSRRRGRTNSS
jgi:membrane protein implicated in regulation of membrane protease activity